MSCGFVQGAAVDVDPALLLLRAEVERAIAAGSVQNVRDFAEMCLPADRNDSLITYALGVWAACCGVATVGAAPCEAQHHHMRVWGGCHHAGLPHVLL